MGRRFKIEKNLGKLMIPFKFIEEAGIYITYPDIPKKTHSFEV